MRLKFMHKQLHRGKLWRLEDPPLLVISPLCGDGRDEPGLEVRGLAVSPLNKQTNHSK